MDPQGVDLALRLSEVAVRNTAGVVSDRIQAAKAKRKDAEVVAEMEEIISSLIADKNEVVQIAQVLEEKFVAQRVSETEIDYVTTNLVPLIERLVAAASGPNDTSTQDSIALQAAPVGRNADRPPSARLQLQAGSWRATDNPAS